MIRSEHIIAKKPVPDNANKWMLSFADLLSLILTFFVLIYSMADPIQFTNKHKEDYNSSIAFQLGDAPSQIKSAKQQTNVDNNYMLQVFADKSNNDEGMKSFIANIVDNKLTVKIPLDNLNELAIKSFRDTITSLDATIRFVTADVATSRDVAIQFKNQGLPNPISYFEDKSLQNNLEIIIYPEF